MFFWDEGDDPGPVEGVEVGLDLDQTEESLRPPTSSGWEGSNLDQAEVTNWAS